MFSRRRWRSPAGCGVSAAKRPSGPMPGERASGSLAPRNTTSAGGWMFRTITFAIAALVIAAGKILIDRFARKA